MASDQMGESDSDGDYSLHAKKQFNTTFAKEYFIDHSDTYFLNKSSEMNPRRENYIAPQLSYH
jgi:hypothetical protein